jgi:uncharacterized protein YuzE
MRWTYDLNAGALYVSIAEGNIEHQVEMPDGVVVDVDAQERVIGIEVLAPWRGWAVSALVDRFDLSSEDARALGALAQQPFILIDDRNHSAPASGTAGRSGTAPELVEVA